jgi:hypothetical protein
VARTALEIADIFRDHGPAWREANRGHVSLEQLKVMSAIERCRTAALGGHVARCENGACGHTVIAYNRFYEERRREDCIHRRYLEPINGAPRCASPSNAKPSFANRNSASRTI